MASAPRTPDRQTNSGESSGKRVTTTAVVTSVIAFANRVSKKLKPSPSPSQSPKPKRVSILKEQQSDSFKIPQSPKKLFAAISDKAIAIVQRKKRSEDDTEELKPDNLEPKRITILKEQQSDSNINFKLPQSPRKLFDKAITLVQRKKRSDEDDLDLEPKPKRIVVLKEQQQSESCKIPRSPKKLFAKFHGKNRSVDDDDDVEGSEDFGDGGVWQRSILMGDKCEPLNFSGVIYYDSHGKQMSELPSRSPRASPIPSYLHRAEN